MIPIIFPSNLKSIAAKELAKSLNTKRVRPDGNYKYKDNHLIINYGNQTPPIWNTNKVKWINHPAKIKTSVNKRLTFEKLKENKVSVPDFSIKKEDAIGWIKDGFTVVCRELLEASQGKGIIIATKLEELSPKTKLYVRYFPKKYEYRVHLIRNKGKLVIFDFAEKKKRADLDNKDVNWKIRNHGQFVFCRKDVKLPKCVQEESIKAGEALGLDLISVDICYSQKNDKCVILEINSASGLEGQTIKNYSNEILGLCNGNF